MQCKVGGKILSRALLLFGGEELDASSRGLALLRAAEGEYHDAPIVAVMRRRKAFVKKEYLVSANIRLFIQETEFKIGFRVRSEEFPRCSFLPYFVAVPRCWTSRSTSVFLLRWPFVLWAVSWYRQDGALALCRSSASAQETVISFLSSR